MTSSHASPGEPGTLHQVTRAALHLVERVQPADAIPDATLQEIGAQTSACQLWLASILTELAILRQAVAPAHHGPPPPAWHDLTGPTHDIFGLRAAALFSIADSPPMPDVPYIRKLEFYVRLAHKFSREHSVKHSSLDARGRAPPPFLTS